MHDIQLIWNKHFHHNAKTITNEHHLINLLFEALLNPVSNISINTCFDFLDEIKDKISLSQAANQQLQQLVTKQHKQISTLKLKIILHILQNEKQIIDPNLINGLINHSSSLQNEKTKIKINNNIECLLLLYDENKTPQNLDKIISFLQQNLQLLDASPNQINAPIQIKLKDFLIKNKKESFLYLLPLANKKSTTTITNEYCVTQLNININQIIFNYNLVDNNYAQPNSIHYLINSILTFLNAPSKMKDLISSTHYSNPKYYLITSFSEKESKLHDFNQLLDLSILNGALKQPLNQESLNTQFQELLKKIHLINRLNETIPEQTQINLPNITKI